MKGFEMREVKLAVTKEIVNHKEEYFLTRQYNDDTPDESIPIDFHRKCKDESKNSDPWRLWKEKQQQDEEDKNEEALGRPMKTIEK